MKGRFALPCITDHFLLGSIGTPFAPFMAREHWIGIIGHIMGYIVILEYVVCHFPGVSTKAWGHGLTGPEGLMLRCLKKGQEVQA